MIYWSEYRNFSYLWGDQVHRVTESCPQEEVEKGTG